MKYQIPSDLLSYAVDKGQLHEDTLEEKVSKVRKHADAMIAMIGGMKVCFTFRSLAKSLFVL